MGCKVCKKDKKIAARGLCSACYSRWNKKGTTDYDPKRERHPCSVDGCDVVSVARSLCDRHYRRLMKHDDVDGDARPESWGAIYKHPLRNSYKHLTRYRTSRPIDERWDDFLQFVADVGERPSKHHRLIRPDELRPIGPDNFRWRESACRKENDDTKAEAAARYQRQYRVLHPDRVRHTVLANKYGISLVTYEEMLDKQDHKCAICSVNETMVIRGKQYRLAVDHDHKTGKVRGLLCSSCNRGIGYLRDDINIFKKAIDYLS